MEHFSLWHWLITIALWWFLLGWPITRILRRMGLSVWWVLLALIPIANLIGLWVLATAKWPKTD